MSIIIGLTGPTGAGKSAVRAVAEDLGYRFVDCDILARKAVEKGTKGLSDLTDAFGMEIINNDGSLNRKMLANIAFSSRENTELLNKTLLPHILKLALEEIKNDEYIIFDAPTLFESGLHKKCDKIISVMADKDIRLKRIIERDGISLQAALMRMNAGKTDDFYEERSDYLIYNNGDIREFNSQINHILKEISGGI